MIAISAVLRGRQEILTLFPLVYWEAKRGLRGKPLFGVRYGLSMGYRECHAVPLLEWECKDNLERIYFILQHSVHFITLSSQSGTAKYSSTRYCKAVPHSKKGQAP